MNLKSSGANSRVISRRFVSVFSLIAAVPVFGQSLDVQAAAGQDSKSGSAIVSILSPAGKEPVALQWEFSLPLSIQPDPRKVQAGEAATQAKKSVRCEILANRQGKDQICRCILAGGVSPIPNGPVAILPYFLARSAHPGRYDVEIKNAFAVSGDMKKIAVKDTKTEVQAAK